MDGNKKKGFVPQDEEYYQDTEPVLTDVKPITDPDAGPTKPEEKGILKAPAEPVVLNAEQQLAKDYVQQIQDENAVADEQIKSVADLLAVAEKERKAKQEEDKDYQRRENAARYIAGIGDAISGVANLVGTAHGASNQRQSYNSPRLMEQTDRARRARARDMDTLNKRIDELREREQQVRSSKSLRDAQLKAQFAKEQRAIRLQQERDALAREKFEQAIEEAEIKAEASADKLEETTRANKAKEATAAANAAAAQQRAATAQQREDRLGKVKTGKSLFDEL